MLFYNTIFVIAYKSNEIGLKNLDAVKRSGFWSDRAQTKENFVPEGLVIHLHEKDATALFGGSPSGSPSGQIVFDGYRVAMVRLMCPA
jgi:hypothetical protein